LNVHPSYAGTDHHGIEIGKRGFERGSLLSFQVKAWRGTWQHRWPKPTCHDVLS